MPSFLKEFWSTGKAEYVTFLLQRLFADVDFHCQHVHSCLHPLKSRNCVSRPRPLLPACATNSVKLSTGVVGLAMAKGPKALRPAKLLVLSVLASNSPSLTPAQQLLGDENDAEGGYAHT